MFHDMFVKACNVLTLNSQVSRSSSRRHVQLSPSLSFDALEIRLTPSSMMMPGGDYYYPSYGGGSQVSGMNAGLDLDTTHTFGIVPGTIVTIISSESDTPSTDDPYSNQQEQQSGDSSETDVVGDNGQPVGSFPIESGSMLA